MQEDSEANVVVPSGYVRATLIGRLPALVGIAAVLGVTWMSSGSWWLAVACGAVIASVDTLVIWRNSRRTSRPVAPPQSSDAIENLSAMALALALPDPILVIDRHGGVIFANRPATETFGAIRSGLPVQMKFRSPEMQSLVSRSLGGGGAVEGEFSERLPLERTFRVAINPLGEASDRFVMSFKDQSEARRIDRMRADFIANASHELRTPLASIAGFVETLRGPAKSDAAARERFLQIMHDQAKRMSRLIDDLLSLSRLEMKPTLNAGTTVDVKQIVDGVIDSLGPLVNELNVTVTRNYVSRPVEVLGSSDELFQVFENLLENACKYGQSGGRVEVRVDVLRERGIEEASISFRDFGPGISEEHIPRITERFYRVDVATSRSQKGTGLGLSIVKHILTRHGGRLAIKSELGVGAEFTVLLPMAYG